MNDRIPGSCFTNPIRYRGFEIYLEDCPFHEGSWFTYIRVWPVVPFDVETTGNEWTESACKIAIDKILGANDSK